MPGDRSPGPVRAYLEDWLYGAVVLALLAWVFGPLVVDRGTATTVRPVPLPAPTTEAAWARADAWLAANRGAWWPAREGLDALVPAPSLQCFSTGADASSGYVVCLAQDPDGDVRMECRFGPRGVADVVCEPAARGAR